MLFPTKFISGTDDPRKWNDIGGHQGGFLVPTIRQPIRQLEDLVQFGTVFGGLRKEGDTFYGLSAHGSGKLGLGENLDSRPARSLGGTGTVAMRVLGERR